MIGLLWKDILVLRKTLKTYALFLLLYLGMAVAGIFPISFAITFIQVILMMLPLSAFAYDELAKWDRYAAAFPLPARTMVAARYAFVLLTVLVAAAFGSLACVFLSLTRQGNLVENLVLVLASMGVGMLIPAIMLPLNYKLGRERAQPYLYAIIFLPTIGFFLVSKAGLLDGFDFSSLNSLNEGSVLAMFSLIPLIGLGLLALSWVCSSKIVDRKEF